MILNGDATLFDRLFNSLFLAFSVPKFSFLANDELVGHVGLLNSLDFRASQVVPVVGFCS